jgi:hypothetical protein
MKNKKTILFIILGIMLIAVGLCGGYFYQKKKGCAMPNFSKASLDGAGPQMAGTPPTGTSSATSNRGGQGNGGPGGSTGEIISKDDKSITIKLSDGSTKIVYFSDSTKITKTQTASNSDLSVGTSVSAMGATNTDKSVTAQNITIQSK